MAVVDNRLLEAHNKQYQSTVVELLARNKGGYLKRKTKHQNCKGNESTFFNTVGGIIVNRTGNFADGNFTEVSGNFVKGLGNTDFAIKKIEVKPVPIYAGTYVHETEYDKTLINIDQTIVAGHVDALAVEEDLDVLKALCQGLKSGFARPVPSANIIGDKAVALTVDSYIKAIEMARLILGTGENISIIANKKDIIELKMSENYMGMSKEYGHYFGERAVGDTRFATCELITWRDDLLDVALAHADGGALTDTATVGRIMVMVDNRALCSASWNESIKTGITYHPDRSEYLLKATIDVGASILDPRAIFVIQFKK